MICKWSRGTCIWKNTACPPPPPPPPATPLLLIIPENSSAMMSACHAPTATIFQGNVCCECTFRSVCASKIMVLALRSMVLSVLQGAGKNLRGRGAVPRYVALARTLQYHSICVPTFIVENVITSGKHCPALSYAVARQACLLCTTCPHD